MDNPAGPDYWPEPDVHVKGDDVSQPEDDVPVIRGKVGGFEQYLVIK